MKYTSKVMLDASKSLRTKLNLDPALMRKKLHGELDLHRTVVEYTSHQARNLGQGEINVEEAILSAVMYGFVLREELAAQMKRQQKKGE